VIDRCVWCDGILWPWTKRSPGGVMHSRCNDYVNAVYLEDQRAYEQNQARLRWEEEDRL